MSRRAARVWLTLSNICSSRGPSDSPKGRSTDWWCSRADNPTPRLRKTARITGSRFRRIGGSWRWRSRRTGCAGRSFDPAEVELERRVIAEERARELNSPQGRLDQTHLALTYIRHPYRNPILGWPEDIAAISVDDLKAFYEAHYTPDQAVLVVVGDVEPEAALDLIASHFADVPAGKTPRPRPTFTEPDQSGRREFVLSDAESAARGLFGWRTVPRAHRDVVVLDVLADLLCCGRRSRLWNALVETDKSVIWIESAHAAAQRAGQFFIQLEAAPGADLAQLERRLSAELDSSPRNRAVGRRARPIATPHQGRVALGARRPDEPRRRLGLRRTLVRLARLADRITCHPDHRRPRYQARRGYLPDRAGPDGRMVAPGRRAAKRHRRPLARSRRFPDAPVAALASSTPLGVGRGRTNGHSPVATTARQPRSPWRYPRGSHGSSTTSRGGSCSRTACDSSSSDALVRALSPSSSSPTRACCAKPNRASPA